MNREKQDLRVAKSKEAMRGAFLKLVLKEPYRKITIVEVTELARVNRKTFYLHYDTLDDLLNDIRQIYVDHVLDSLDEVAPDDMAGGLMVYYEFLNTDDPSAQKLLYDPQYMHFFDQLNRDVITSDFFMNFCHDWSEKALMTGYFDSIVGIFLSWKNETVHSFTLHELSQRAADLIMNGLSAVSPDESRHQ